MTKERDNLFRVGQLVHTSVVSGIFKIIRYTGVEKPNPYYRQEREHEGGKYGLPYLKEIEVKKIANNNGKLIASGSKTMFLEEELSDAMKSINENVNLYEKECNIWQTIQAMNQPRLG